MCKEVKQTSAHSTMYRSIKVRDSEILNSECKHLTAERACRYLTFGVEGERSQWRGCPGFELQGSVITAFDLWSRFPKFLRVMYY